MGKPVVGDLRVWEGRLVRVTDVSSTGRYGAEIIISHSGLLPEKGDVVEAVEDELFTVKAWAEKTGQGIVTFGKEG